MIMPTEFTQRTPRGRQHWLLSVGAVAAASALVLTGCSGSGTSKRHPRAPRSPVPAPRQLRPAVTPRPPRRASGQASTLRWPRTFPVNRHPVAVAVDPAGQMLLVASRFDSVVSLFGLAGGELIADVPVGGSLPVSSSARTAPRRTWPTAATAPSRYSTSTPIKWSRRSRTRPLRLALSPDATVLYVTNSIDGTLSICWSFNYK